MEFWRSEVSPSSNCLCLPTWRFDMASLCHSRSITHVFSLSLSGLPSSFCLCMSVQASQDRLLRRRLAVRDMENQDYYPRQHHVQQFMALQRTDREYSLLEPVCHCSYLPITSAQAMKQRAVWGLNSFHKDFVSLEEGDSFGKPWPALAGIVTAAILGSPELRLTLDELCEVIPRRYYYYRDLAKME